MNDGQGSTDAARPMPCVRVSGYSSLERARQIVDIVLDLAEAFDLLGGSSAGRTAQKIIAIKIEKLAKEL